MKKLIILTLIAINTAAVHAAKPIEQRIAIIKQLTKQVENKQLRRAIKYQLQKLELRTDNLGDEVITVTGR